MLPTAIPALVAFGVLSLVWNWNEFFWPLLVVQSERLATPPLGVVFFANAEAGTNYGALTAAATAITAPLVIAFLVAQRWFIDGVTMTAVKVVLPRKPRGDEGSTHDQQAQVPGDRIGSRRRPRHAWLPAGAVGRHGAARCSIPFPSSSRT